MTAEQETINAARIERLERRLRVLEDTEAIRTFNQARAGDPRISLSLVPIGDGLTLARKR